MEKETCQKSYDFTADYKELPIKERVSLIKIAKNLLSRQKKDGSLFTSITAFPSVYEEEKIINEE
jgi:hypothetical protein